MINDGNTPKNPKAYDKDSTGLHRTVSAFGIVGEQYSLLHLGLHVILWFGLTGRPTRNINVMIRLNF